MTRADHFKLALAIKKSLERIPKDENFEGSRAVLAFTASTIANTCADDNEKFNREGFFKDCGLAE